MYIYVFHYIIEMKDGSICITRNEMKILNNNYIIHYQLLKIYKFDTNIKI